MNKLFPWVAPAVVLCLMPPVWALAASTQPAPTEPVQLQYRSAFATYQPWKDLKAGDWRALNDAAKGDMGMADIPGMQDQGMAMPAAPASSPASAAAVPAHAEHHKHGVKP